MSALILRITGGVFWGGALLMAYTWHESANRITSVEQSLFLQNGQSTSVKFIPYLENAVYSIDLKFDKSHNKSLNCQNIRSSDIQWSLAQGNNLLLTGKLSDSTVRCSEIEDTAIAFDIPIPERLENQQHFLNLAVANQQPEVKLKSNISIKPFGIAVHYAFMDLAFQEIALGILSILGIGCFLPDLYRILFRRKSK